MHKISQELVYKLISRYDSTITHSRDSNSFRKLQPGRKKSSQTPPVSYLNSIRLTLYFKAEMWGKRLNVCSCSIFFLQILGKIWEKKFGNLCRLTHLQCRQNWSDSTLNLDMSYLNSIRLPFISKPRCGGRGWTYMYMWLFNFFFSNLKEDLGKRIWETTHLTHLQCRQTRQTPHIWF